MLFLANRNQLFTDFGVVCFSLSGDSRGSQGQLGKPIYLLFQEV